MAPRDGDRRTHQRLFLYFRTFGSRFRSSASDLADELEDILVRSIRRRMIADVPVGAFLSGGVDSSTVCALMRRKLGVPISTYSIGFKDEPEGDTKPPGRSPSILRLITMR